ncbi:MAG: hypothetical protein IPL78_24990 [Chloroflexi bacterium]|nr:hypothetical protein [Chloroflexota bacterium]
MTPSMTTNSLPDFETIFRQIVGQTTNDTNSPHDEEWLSAGLAYTDNNHQLLLEVLCTSETRYHNRPQPQQWESLKRKLNQL